MTASIRIKIVDAQWDVSLSSNSKYSVDSKKRDTKQEGGFIKRIVSIGIACGALLASAIAAYAITTLFVSQSVTSNLSKKQVFQIVFDSNGGEGEVGPGDSFPVNPVVVNDATEDMYVFIQIQMPGYSGASQQQPEDSLLYTFIAGADWKLVESDHESVVYAYTSGNDGMTPLQPGEKTSALTTQMTMRSITNAEYAAIGDINIKITCYAVGTDGVSTNPSDAWNECKTIGNVS